jgi:hypothetical protein
MQRESGDVGALAAANLVLRFLLELAGLFAAGYWGFASFDTWFARIALGIGVPAAMAAAWGVFRIPNDGGAPVVEVAPAVRLLLEAVFFGLAAVLLWAAGREGWAIAFLAVIVIHYAVDYRRTLALAANRLPRPR